MDGATDRDRRWYARAGAVATSLVVLGSLAFLALLDGVREHDDLTRLDVSVLNLLVAWRGPVEVALLRAVSAVAGPDVLPWLVVVGCLAWGLLRREVWRPALLAASVGLASLLGLAVKGLVRRPRPPLVDMDVPGSETTTSFPSGHTLGTATLLLVLGYLLIRHRHTLRRVVTCVVVAVVGTAAVGLSRLALGYHFLTDVLAAIALAVAVLGVVMLVDLRHVRQAPPGPPSRGRAAAAG